MKNTSIILFSFSLLFPQVSEGYTIFTPYADGTGTSTYMLNTDGSTLHMWSHERAPASMPYLLPDSTIIYPYRVTHPTMEAGGVGGGIQSIDWDGNILWDYQISNEIYQHHHDIEPMPNGNVLAIVWEKKTASEAFEMGRQEIDNALNQMWSTAILELDSQSGEIVWEWHIWDHLVQNISDEYPNFGVISEHPELFNINCGNAGNNAGGPQGANGDWMHINAIDYNIELDQIAISSRTQNEIYIIDHSTTVIEAASHSGGNSGKGGDFLYRWGNPENYDQGDESNKILSAQHGLNWIPEGFPGEGNLILFNNFHTDGTSAVIEIETPLNENGSFSLDGSGQYGPESWEWGYFGNITTPMQGGAFRLSNGNTLITQTHMARIIEVNMNGEILWDFTYDSGIGSYWIARAQKYPLDYFTTSFILGDVNNDGVINILDVVSTVNIVLGLADWVDAADYNNDGIINVLDIVSIVNVIMAD
ncbi:MAG: aryl-sulfate sulfotransferase [Candidatus Marinimicrobia bacterium]|nr:aryl-sulfate sulfotransferase [Candidatus Neomarinimicrobiota bacterium]